MKYLQSKISIIFADLIIFSLAYIFSFNAVGKGQILSENYLYYFLFYFSSWVIAGYLSSKFTTFTHLIQRKNLLAALQPVFFSLLLMMGLLAIGSLILDFSNVSRYIIAFTLSSTFISEIVFYSILYLSKNKLFSTNKFNIVVSFPIVIIDTIINLTAIFVFFAKSSFELHAIKADQIYIFFVYTIIWIFTGLFFYKYEGVNLNNNFWRNIYPNVKSNISFILIITFAGFFFRVSNDFFSELLTFSSAASILSTLSISIYYFTIRPSKTDEVATSFKSVPEISYSDLNVKTKQKTDDDLLINSVRSDSEFEQKLRDIYLRDFNEIYEFVIGQVDLSKYDINTSLVMRSADPYNVEVQMDDSLCCLMNLHKLNDFRRINKYLIDINKKLITGGLFIGKFESNKLRYKRFLKSYPKYFAKSFYLLDFIWRRIIPKLPVLQRVYFAFTRGRDRALSLAEGLGRIYYCGYKIKGLKEIDNNIYFISRKVKEPASDSNPSYGPLFKMRRTGKNGKPIFVYKFRTMHPYSEYLQDFMYEQFGSSTGDKIDNDFRVTAWGHWMRKLWIDELPMIYNLLKGDLKLYGVRPVSKSKFKLYPQEMQKLRTTVKPGLVPPYYADLPKNFEQLIESEKKYIHEYLKHPTKTDLEYLVKTFKNIVIEKARSA